MTNPNDAIRDKVLRHLYSIHAKSRSPKSAGVGIRDLVSAMKPLRQHEVSSNLDYLVQKGWVTEVVEDRSFTTPRGTTQHSERRTYKISAVGIDHLEQASLYQRATTDARINITNIRGVTVVGDGNVVNTTFSDLSHVLADMRKTVLECPSVNDEQKLVAASDIDTLQAQLQKPEPNRTIVQTVWAGIEKAAAVAGAADLAAKAAVLLAPFLS